jgi:glycosyl-4,4'-diaponeurosporenoate acyltransferase
MERTGYSHGRKAMRILFLPDVWTFLLCFPVWALLQTGAALICLHLPDRFFSPHSVLFRSHSFEKAGRIYDRIFRVSRWKHLLPDGGQVWKKRGFKKKNLDNFSESNLNRFLVESARGEMTHWLAIFPFWVFWLFTPPIVPWIMLAYALLVNLPCIIAQRYNRPRIHRLLERNHSQT